MQTSVKDEREAAKNVQKKNRMLLMLQDGKQLRELRIEQPREQIKRR